MKFVSERDTQYFKHINNELVEEVIETPIILYKLNIVQTKSNIYGEAPSKAYHVGTQISAMISRQDKVPTTDGYIIDFNQTAVFSFLRTTCEEKDVYPEVGDIIEYDGSFWEINNAVENQLLAAQPFFNWAIICTTHMTRRSILQLEERQHLSKDSIV